MKNRWSRGEKAIWMAPLLLGVLAAGIRFGPDLVRRGLNRPQQWHLAPDVKLDSLAVSRDGQVLVASGWANVTGVKSMGSIHLLDVRSGEHRTIFAPTTEQVVKDSVHSVHGLTLSPDGKSIGFSRVNQPWTIYDLATQKMRWRFTKDVWQAQFSPDGRWIALEGNDYVTVVAAENGNVRSRWKGHSPGPLAWSPDGTQVASLNQFSSRPQNGERDKTRVGFEVHRATDGKLLNRIEDEGTVGIAFSPDGRSLVVAANPRKLANRAKTEPLRCYSTSSGTLLWAVPAMKISQQPGTHSNFVDVAFSPDGSTVAAGQLSVGRILLLDSSNGKVTRELWLDERDSIIAPLSPSLNFTSNGKWLFARGNNSVYAWDL
ncbi:WD40 repeat domain-containing protein [bacterium]|nr:MAG: WD40 repeat domain-containing protein [bacterium]